MDWVTKPKVSDDFELFAGPEDNKQTEYVPGQFVQVSLRAKKYGEQYRGLLLYAVDAADTTSDPVKIGTWEVSPKYYWTILRLHSNPPPIVH